MPTPAKTPSFGLARADGTRKRGLRPLPARAGAHIRKASDRRLGRVAGSLWGNEYVARSGVGPAAELCRGRPVVAVPKGRVSDPARMEGQMSLYVIQVVGGREQRVCDLVIRQLSGLIADCFVPRREVMRRREGR